MATETRTDDPSIGNSAPLWRRVPEQWLVWDTNQNSVRPSSLAFDHFEMSVVLGEDVARGGRSAAQCLEQFPSNALFAITAGLARDKGQVVCRDPDPAEPCHALVVGAKTKSVARAFARAATPVLVIPDAQIEAIKSKAK